MSDLLHLKNIGKNIEKKLISIGIDSKQKLFEIGSRQAFVDLKQKISQYLFSSFICLRRCNIGYRIR